MFYKSLIFLNNCIKKQVKQIKRTQARKCDQIENLTSEKQRKVSTFDVLKVLKNLDSDIVRYSFYKDQVDFLEARNLMNDKTRYSENIFKLGLANLENQLELMEECDIEKTEYNLCRLGYYHTAEISKLKEDGVLKKSFDVANLLEYLEPFPFDKNLKLPKLTALEERFKPARLYHRYKTLRDYSEWLESELRVPDNTICGLRKEIMRQYCAWKFKVALPIVDHHMYTYLCFKSKQIQSVRCLRRVFKILEIDFQLPKNKIQQNFFLLRSNTQKLTELINKKTIFNIPITEIAKLFPKVITRDRHSLEELEALFKDHGITEEQVRAQKDILTLSLRTVQERLEYLKSCPDLCVYKRSVRFLFLVMYLEKVKKRVTELKARNISCVSIQILCGREDNFQTFLIEGTSRMYKIGDSVEYIAQQLGTNKEIKNKLMQKLKKHSLGMFIPVLQLQESLNYLQERGFSNQTILDTPEILFYPKEKLETTLDRINHDQSLAAFGLDGGFVKQSRTSFACGSSDRDKRLSLCVYFIERDVHFSGEGVLLEQQDEVNE